MKKKKIKNKKGFKNKVKNSPPPKISNIIIKTFFIIFITFTLYIIKSKNEQKIPLKIIKQYNNISKSYKEENNIFNKTIISNEKNFNNINELIEIAKSKYEIAEYYKSLKDCEKIINSLNNEKNNSFIEIYQLIVLNYIQMFDLEKAKEFLKECESIDVNNNKNKELSMLIEKEERNNEENIKKSKSYSSYLNFMKELYKMGVFINKLEIKFITENYRYCRATKDIYEKEMLFKIPLQSLITLDTAKKSQIGIYFTDELNKKIKSPKQSLLTAFLLNEMDKGDQSNWKFYLDFFPSNYSSFPTFYSEKELEYLKGSQFLEMVEKRKNYIKYDYDILIKEIPGFSKYDFNLFKKMKEVVGSRVFGVQINNRSNIILVPFADLLNHNRRVKTYWGFNNTMNSFYIRSIGNITKGDEVFCTYGIKANKVYLLHYGFTVENNTVNKFNIEFLLNKSYPYIKEKISFFNYPHKKSFEININLKNDKTNKFFSFLRIILYNESDFKKIDANKPISIDNEKDVMNKIKEIMMELLNKYPTNLENDVNYIKKSKQFMDFNEYNCYVIRIEEKEILNFYYNMSNDILKLFNITDKIYIKKIYRKIKGSYLIYLEYDSFIEKLLKYKDYLLSVFPLLNISNNLNL